MLNAKLTEALCAERLDGDALDAPATADPGAMGAYLTHEMMLSRLVDFLVRSCGATNGHRLDGRFYAELFPGPDHAVDRELTPAQFETTPLTRPRSTI